MTETFQKPHSGTAGHPEADAPFLRRILFGLVAATMVCGAVAVALTSQHELIEGTQVATTSRGPA